VVKRKNVLARRTGHVNVIESFHFKGLYRVQTSRQGAPSELAGHWTEKRPTILTSSIVNEALEQNIAYKATETVSLRAAEVSMRTGKFATEPDILYKRDLFVPENGTPALPFEIVDVRKSVNNWHHRLHFSRECFEDRTWEAVSKSILNLEDTIINEYYCHEAGHLLGEDVRTKQQNGYFRPGQKLGWPLVFVEEFRADLHAFGFALTLLPVRSAVAIFFYNIALRFGTHRMSAKTTCKNYGSIPFLLFHLLMRLEVFELTPDKNRLRLSTSLDSIPDCMQLCSRHVLEDLTSQELNTSDQIAMATNAASYYRAKILDKPMVEKFAKWTDSENL
jgi:hypothetical protein